MHTGVLIRTLTGHTEAIVATAFSPDGNTIASTSDDKTIRLWNVSNGSIVHILNGSEEHVQAVAFSPDGKRLLTGGRDKPVIGELLQNFLGDSKMNKGVSMRLWDIESGKILQTFSQHTNDANDVAYAPDGKWIASASEDRTVHIWKLAN
jgi:WD40 repeat protein